MPSVATRLGEVSYRIQGKGQPIVMLHATLHDGRDFDALTLELAQRYQTIVVDWPWHGESKGLSTIQGLSAVAIADTLEDFVAALDLPPAFFIGNSVGGFAAARLAISRPQAVRGLVLVNSGGFATWTFFLRLGCRLLGIPLVARLLFPSLISRYMNPQTAEDDAITHRTIDKARTSIGASVAAAMWRSFLDDGHDLRSRGKEIKAPTLIVWGVRDPTFPPGSGEAVQNCIPGSRLELIEAGHVVFSSRPEEFLHVVEPFFQSVLAGSPA